MLAAKLSFRWPQCARTDLKKIIHSSNNDGIDLIAATLNWDPKRRPNATQVQNSTGTSNSNLSTSNDSASIGSDRSRDSKQIFAEDWQTDGVTFFFFL
jgi:hypothetical protein